MGAPGAGWYDDGSGTMRWWDGARWAEAPPVPQPPVPAPQPPAAGASHPPPTADVAQALDPATQAAGGPAPRRGRVWIAVAAVAAVVVAVAGVSAFFLARGGAAQIAGPQPTPTATEQADVVAAEADEPDDDLLHPETWDITGPAVEPADEAEAAAVAAVLGYESSWESGDCEAYMNSTSPRWREALYIEDCDAFAQVAASIGESGDEISTALIKQTGAQSYVIGVVHTMTVDPESLPEGATEPAEPPVWRSLASYHVRERGGQWHVDEVHDLDDGREEWEMAPGEQAASDLTLEQWERAIVGSDCDALMASTTENFRSRSGFVDCAALQASNQERDVYCTLSVEPVESHYQTRWDTHHDEIIATVEETCLYRQDADGNTLDAPEKGEPRPVEFHLVYDWDVGRWLIDNVG